MLYRVSKLFTGIKKTQQKIWVILGQICVLLFFSCWYQSLIILTTSAGMAVHARLMQLSQEVDNIAHTSCDVHEKKSELENASRFGTDWWEDRKQECYVRKQIFFKTAFSFSDEPTEEFCFVQSVFCYSRHLNVGHLHSLTRNKNYYYEWAHACANGFLKRHFRCRNETQA